MQAAAEHTEQAAGHLEKGHTGSKKLYTDALKYADIFFSKVMY